MTSIEFLERYLIHTGFFIPVSLTTAGNNIFWTESNSNFLYSINNNNDTKYTYENLLLFKYRRQHVVFRKFI